MMSLERLFHSVESRLYHFGRRLCRDPLAEVREEADEVAEALEQRRTALHRCREEMAELRGRLKTNEARAGLLASRVESYLHVHDGPTAWQYALELDNLRRSLGEDRQRLRQALQVERDCLERIRALESRLGELQDKLCRR